MTTLLCIFALVLAVGCLIIALSRNHEMQRELDRLEIAARGSRRNLADRREWCVEIYPSLHHNRTTVRRKEDRNGK